MEQVVNYDESKVPTYQLPDPLHFADGTPVTTAATWSAERRAQVLFLFEEYVYGRTPTATIQTTSELTSIATDALNGLATRKQYTLHFDGADAEASLDLLLYLPNHRSGKVPAFLGLNFFGNHSIHKDPAISLSTSWMRDSAELGVHNNRATEAARGTQASRWPLEHILSRGYAVGTAYYGDIDPDFDDVFQNGIHPLFYRAGQIRPNPDEWGAIGAWAWGLQRALDQLIADGDINGEKVALLGHSRLGKAALWAGAQDQRFALVISNDSGCGGAALSRRRFGETVAHINTRFPHWFCANFHAFNDREDDLPIDQHMLLALVAPRPLYVASAAEDLWADPKGEYLSAYHAGPVYQLFAAEGLSSPKMPQVEMPLMGRIGYHIRRGGHDVTLYDWDRFIDFADLHFK